MTLAETISIVIPARNEAGFIESALQSVLAQQYPRDALEAIVVDNGSVDGTAAIARGFAARHPDPKVTLVDEPEAGVGRAKNRGAEVAEGMILIFLDADSRMEAGLARAVEWAFLAGSPAGSIRITADSRHPIDRGFFALMEFGKVRFGIRGQMLYCSRDLFQELGGFNPHLRLGEDIDLLRRIRKCLGGSTRIAHVRVSGIVTSPRRLRRWPLHLGMIPMFARWVGAFLGVGRRREY